MVQALDKVVLFGVVNAIERVVPVKLTGISSF